MSLCNRNLTPFQRRSMQRIGGMLGGCVALSLFPELFLDPRHFSLATQLAVAILSTFPVIGTMVVIARYLAGETDEYLRSIVIQSILWGLGLVMVADTFFGYIVEYHPSHLPIGIFNMDIFVITGMISLRIQLWRNR
jgi:small-conductance mechanosensitive channel